MSGVLAIFMVLISKIDMSRGHVDSPIHRSTCKFIQSGSLDATLEAIFEEVNDDSHADDDTEMSHFPARVPERTPMPISLPERSLQAPWHMKQLVVHVKITVGQNKPWFMVVEHINSRL